MTRLGTHSSGVRAWAARPRLCGPPSSVQSVLGRPGSFVVHTELPGVKLGPFLVLPGRRATTGRVNRNGAGPGPSVCCVSGREPGWTPGWPEAQAVGGVGWGQRPLFRGLLATVAGYFHAATRTPPPRSRPRLRGLCSPPTPATCFSGVCWRAARPWRLGRSWRTGAAPQGWVGARFGLPESMGPSWRLRAPELASLPCQSVWRVRRSGVWGPMGGATGTHSCMGVQLGCSGEGTAT